MPDKVLILKRITASIFIVFLMALAFGQFLVPAPEANALNAALAHSNTTNSALVSFTITVTTTAGNALALFVRTAFKGTADYNCQAVTITDSFANTWVLDTGLQSKFFSSPNFLCIWAESFTAFSSGTGTDTITVTLSTVANQWSNTVATAMDVSGANSTPLLAMATGTCSSSCTSPHSTTTSVTGGGSNPAGTVDVPPGSIALAFGIGWNPGTISPGTSYSTVSTDTSSEYSSTSLSTTNFPFGTSVTSDTWVTIGIVLGLSSGNTATITSTSTATQQTSTIGGGTPDGGAYISAGSLYWFSQQNPVPSSATMVNMTAVLTAVHINTATGTVYLMLYAVQSPNQAASASTPFKLVYQKAYTVTNGTTNVRLTDAPSGLYQVPGLSYFALGIMANTAASNSASVSASGISVEQGTIGTWYQFNLGATSITPPSIFYGGTGPNPQFYVFAIFKWAVSILTVTSTLTGTISSTVFTTSSKTQTVITYSTSSVTQTETSTQLINAPNMSGINMWIMPLAFILTGLALFGGIAFMFERGRH